MNKNKITRPIPTFSAKDEEFKKFKLPKKVLKEVLDALGHPYMTIGGLFWLANLSVEALGKDAMVIYSAIDAIGEDALIPLSNYRLVMEDGT